MKLKTAAFLLPLVLLLAFSAFAQDPQGPEEAEATKDPNITNETCPVMLGEPVLPDLYVTYKGVRVYFCCESCVDDFNAEPEMYLKNLPQFAEESPEEEHPLGVLHPIAVHFPIAFAAAAALAVLLSLVVGRTFFTTAATFCLVLAALSVVPAKLLGGEAEGAIGRMGEAQHERIEAHELWGDISLYVLLAVALLWLVHRAKSGSPALRWAAIVAVLVAAGIVSYTGFLGGEVEHPGHLSHLLPF